MPRTSACSRKRQQQQQVRFQQDLMSREQTFKQAHPDFDTVVRAGLAGKVSPVLQQALMLVPDGPAGGVHAGAAARPGATAQYVSPHRWCWSSWAG